jgi:endonuclease YncB( thermonuclease family)
MMRKAIVLVLVFMAGVLAAGVTIKHVEADPPPAKDAVAPTAKPAPPVPPVRPRTLTPAGEAANFPGDPPDADQLYVWSLPSTGVQSVIILRVVDGETIEGGYIVPVQFRLKGVTAPESKTPLARAATEALTKLLAGRLVPAKMAGRDQYGRIEADFWLGKADGKDNPGGWASSWMLDQKLSQPPAPVKP